MKAEAESNPLPVSCLCHFLPCSEEKSHQHSHISEFCLSKLQTPSIRWSLHSKCKLINQITEQPPKLKGTLSWVKSQEGFSNLSFLLFHPDFLSLPRWSRVCSLPATGDLARGRWVEWHHPVLRLCWLRWLKIQAPSTSPKETQRM